MRIHYQDIPKHQDSTIITAHNLTFEVRPDFISVDILRDVYLSFMVYVKKRFLFWNYWSFVINKSTLEDAQEYIKIYPLTKIVKEPWYYY